MFDSALDISENGLKKHIFLFHNLFLVEELLHSFMITLLSVECEILQLLLVFSVVENGLWKNHILVYLGVKVQKCGPLTRIDLHNIKHHAILHLFLGIVEVSNFHLLQKSVLLLL